MPLTSQPLAPQHASTRYLISVLLSTQIPMKRHGAGCGDVRHGCWRIAGGSPPRRLGAIPSRGPRRGVRRCGAPNRFARGGAGSRPSMMAWRNSRPGGSVAAAASAAGSYQVIVEASWSPYPSRISSTSAHHLQPGSRHQLELVEPEHVGSLRHERRDHRFPVRLAAQESGWLLVQVLVPPLPQTAEGDVEVAALGGESVLVAGRSLAVGDALEHALADEPVQPVGEDVAGDPQALLELVEAANPEEHVADDQQRPALADNLQRPRDRAVLAFVLPVQHVRNVPASVA